MTFGYINVCLCPRTCLPTYQPLSQDWSSPCWIQCRKCALCPLGPSVPWWREWASLVLWSWCHGWWQLSPRRTALWTDLELHKVSYTGSFMKLNVSYHRYKYLWRYLLVQKLFITTNKAFISCQIKGSCNHRTCSCAFRFGRGGRRPGTGQTTEPDARHHTNHGEDGHCSPCQGWIRHDVHLSAWSLWRGLYAIRGAYHTLYTQGKYVTF